MVIEELLAGRLSGKSLALVAQAVKSPRVAALGANVLRRELGLVKLAHLEAEADMLDTDLTPRGGRAGRAARRIRRSRARSSRPCPRHG